MRTKCQCKEAHLQGVHCSYTLGLLEGLEFELLELLELEFYHVGDRESLQILGRIVT